MHKTGLIALFFCLLCQYSHAQLKLESKGITQLTGAMPNNLVYNDSIFRGSKEFKHLFLRTGNSKMIALYKQHQTNKIIGQLVSILGAVTMVTGVNQLSENKGLGWGLIGGGFITGTIGGSFTGLSQKKLRMAICLFNQQYGSTSLGLGAGSKSAGLVYNF